MATSVTVNQPDQAFSALKHIAGIASLECSRLIDLIVESHSIDVILDLFKWTLGDGFNPPAKDAPSISVPQVFTPAAYVAARGTPTQVFLYLNYVPATVTMQKTRQTLLRRLRRCTLDELDTATRNFLLLLVIRFLPGEHELFVNAVKQGKSTTLAGNLLDVASRREDNILTSHDKNILFGIIADGSNVTAASEVFEYQDQRMGRSLKREENIRLMSIMAQGAAGEAENGRPARARELVTNRRYNRFLNEESRTLLWSVISKKQVA